MSEQQIYCYSPSCLCTLKAHARRHEISGSNKMAWINSGNKLWETTNLPQTDITLDTSDFYLYANEISTWVLRMS